MTEVSADDKQRWIEPVKAWMLHSDAGTGSFMVWEITVISGPVARRRSQTYTILSEKKLLWSYRNKEERKPSSNRPLPRYYSLSVEQIAFTPEELQLKFEEGRQKFIRLKQGDVARTIDNIKYTEAKVAALCNDLRYHNESVEEMQQLDFADTGLK